MQGNEASDNLLREVDALGKPGPAADHLDVTSYDALLRGVIMGLWLYEAAIPGLSVTGSPQRRRLCDTFRQLREQGYANVATTELRACISNFGAAPLLARVPESC